ncbi:MAG: hypothetical protein EB075_12815, partial [Bacteroidetes bacterium]|nr:hypothetical protein [Bacteroidota bacterium]
DTYIAPSLKAYVNKALFWATRNSSSTQQEFMKREVNEEYVPRIQRLIDNFLISTDSDSDSDSSESQPLARENPSDSGSESGSESSEWLEASDSDGEEAPAARSAPRQDETAERFMQEEDYWKNWDADRSMEQIMKDLDQEERPEEEKAEVEITDIEEACKDMESFLTKNHESNPDAPHHLPVLFKGEVCAVCGKIKHPM